MRWTTYFQLHDNLLNIYHLCQGKVADACWLVDAKESTLLGHETQKLRALNLKAL